LYGRPFVFLLLVLLVGQIGMETNPSLLKERENSIQEALDTAEKARLGITKLKADNENF
jgi:F0F1-type ATP synthase membrane subunit b/b'